MRETATLDYADLLDALTAHLVAHVPCRDCCDHTLRHTHAWLREHHPERAGSFLAPLLEGEGMCDCRLLRLLLRMPPAAPAAPVG